MRDRERQRETERDRETVLMRALCLDPSSMWDVSSSACLVLQEFHRLQDENQQLKGICEEQEQALEELGCKLSEY